MNKNIKQLIERLFDDNDDILLDGIDEVPIADMLQIADENTIINWLNEHAVIHRLEGKSIYLMKQTSMGGCDSFHIDQGIYLKYENGSPTVIIDKTDNGIEIKSIQFNAPLPKWLNIGFINASVEFISTELGNMPQIIKGSVLFKYCNFARFPENMSNVDGEIRIEYCDNIISLAGLETSDKLLAISLKHCPKFETTKGIAQSVTCLSIEYCDSFRELIDLPENVLNQLSLYDLPNFSSLKGCPRRMLNDLYIRNCPLITTLKGAPNYVGGTLSCNFCGLTKMEIPNARIRTFSVQNNKLTSLKDGPKEVGGDYYVCKNRLKTLDAENTKMTGYEAKLDVTGNPNLRTIEHAPIGVKPKNILHNKLKVTKKIRR